MIIIPLYMNNFSLSAEIVTKEEKEKCIAKRNEILNILRNNNEGLSTKKIASIINKDIRTVQGIMTVLQKQNKVYNIVIKNEKIWKIEKGIEI